MQLLSGAIHFAVAYALARVANWSGLGPWKRAASAHWTERARLLWPARTTAATNVLIIPAILYLAHLSFFPNLKYGWISDAMCSFVGVLLGTYPFDREIFPDLTFQTWRNQVIASWGVRFGYYVVFIAAMALMPPTFSVATFLIAGAYLVIHFALQYGLFLRYLRWVNYMRPAGTRLQQIVDSISAQMNIRVRAVWQLGGSLATAFAFPTRREMAFSNHLLEICSDEEVAVICAHELAHLSESKAVLAGRLLGSLVLFPMIFVIPLTHVFGPLAVVVPYAMMLVILKFSRRLSHRMENRADRRAFGAQLDEGVYARALEKLYRENQMPAVNINNRQTHPHLYDRMMAAGITPDYPRPRKPERFTWFGWCCFIVVGVIVGVMIGMRQKS
jgi:Zn-dependent protease with chaperone function